MTSSTRSAELIWEGQARDRGTFSLTVRVVAMADSPQVFSSPPPEVFVEVPFTDKLGNKSWREADNDKEKALWRAAFACSVVDLKREVQELKRKLDRLAPGWEEDEDA